MEKSELEGSPLPPDGEKDKKAEKAEARAAKAAQAEQHDPIDKALVARLIIGALILAAGITFAAQNLDGVETQFLSWSFKMSQFLLMVLSAVAGVLIWEFAGAYSRRVKKKADK